MSSRTNVVTTPHGVELPFVERGEPEGVPVVLLHAYADSWRSFERVLPELPASIRAVAFTQRGHGAASRPKSGYRVEDFARDLLDVLDALGIERSALVASSSAGFTARLVAARHPERVLGLVLIGAPWSLHERSELSFVDAVLALQDPVDEAFVRDFVVSTSSASVPADFLERMVAESRLLPAHVWQGTLAGLLDADPETYGAIAVPTLVLWGDRDAIVSRDEQRRLLEAIPASRLVVYEGGGHVLHWEQPERVALNVAAFALGLPR
jgi:pimeloyl-ACP methyl ester carboxylesterase